MENVSGKRQKRRRGSRKRKTPHPLDFDILTREKTNEERRLFSNEKKGRSQVDESEGLKRAEENRIKAKSALELETEAFISNIPFGKSPKDLVGFILSRIIQINSVVRCQFLKDKRSNGHSGCAIVLFKNFQLYQQFERTPNLTFDGRLLRVKKGNGASKNQRKVPSEIVSFSADGLQLALGLSKEAIAVGGFPSVIEWQTALNDENPVSMDIDSVKRSIVLRFDNMRAGIQDSYTVEMSMRRISRVIVGREVGSGDMIVSFHLLYPPRLYKKEKRSSLGDLISTCLGLGLFSDLTNKRTLASGLKSSFL